MTREQAELIIKEEKLIDTDWYPSYKHSGEYHLTMWFDSDNNKYETFYVEDQGSIRLSYSFDNEKEAIDKMLKMNYRQKYFSVDENYSMRNGKEVALKIIKEENLEVIWYDEALKPLCAGIKHDKQRDKYISFITNAKAEIIEYRSIEFDGDRYSETFERMLNDESIALYALINRARMIKQNRISFV
ncbi:hypothetical protein [Campylobacter jejuni]|uniref:Uncharacterized protein n=1 Tax=Campylobacter jejuni TaxID=197 RepID=A0A431G5J9_CAMJU|nr:hypothetical protein [Campylobacter jejuni]RTI80195.1 hypothetical protein C3I10_09265 [Campylobacter jejuni]RTJ03584.1 hypothetical protein C3H99_08445 [Campylobacter jejuni]RTJ09206.1 hypothetical protein C3H92_08660 [Campylobacter jejuni]RTJ19911.1 hypothetical protein C3H88_08575 [Campylobacter jejuni]RTJ30374.1 hypothetical protein C3H81_08740 [Campylobacter jejuni]